MVIKLAVKEFKKKKKPKLFYVVTDHLLILPLSPVIKVKEKRGAPFWGKAAASYKHKCILFVETVLPRIILSSLQKKTINTKTINLNTLQLKSCLQGSAFGFSSTEN